MWAVTFEFNAANWKSGRLYTNPRYSARRATCLTRRKVRAAAVHKCGFGLPESSGHGLPGIAGRIKNQRAGPSQNVGLNLVLPGKVTTPAPVAWCTLAWTLNGPPDVRFCCVFRS